MRYNICCLSESEVLYYLRLYCAKAVQESNHMIYPKESGSLASSFQTRLRDCSGTMRDSNVQALWFMKQCDWIRQLP